MNFPKEFLIVKPVKRQSIQGRRLTVTDPNGRTTSTDSAPKSTLTFALQRRPDGKLNSGLDEYIPNPYKAKTAEESKLTAGWLASEVWKLDKITKQTELEIKFDLPEGYLTNVPTFNIRKRRKKDVEPTYLESFRYLLENVENKISLDSLKGAIFYEAAKKSSIIANSEAEIGPFSRFYIAEVQEEEVKKARKQRARGKAIAALEDIFENHTDALKQVAVILKIVTASDASISNLAIYNRLSDFINDTARGESNINAFMEVVDLYKTKGKRKLFTAKALLRDLVSHNVLRETKGAIYWRSKQDTSLYELGRTEEVVVQWLLDEGNKPYLEELTHELKVKSDGY